MTVLYPRLAYCAVDVATRKRHNGRFTAVVEFLDKPNSTGSWLRTQTIYRMDGFRTRSAARWHAECRQREIVQRSDILRTYRDRPDPVPM